MLASLPTLMGDYMDAAGYILMFYRCLFSIDLLRVTLQPYVLYKLAPTSVPSPSPSSRCLAVRPPGSPAFPVLAPTFDRLVS